MKLSWNKDGSTRPPIPGLFLTVRWVNVISLTREIQ